MSKKLYFAGREIKDVASNNIKYIEQCKFVSTGIKESYNQGDLYQLLSNNHIVPFVIVLVNLYESRISSQALCDIRSMIKFLDEQFISGNEAISGGSCDYVVDMYYSSLLTTAKQHKLKEQCINVIDYIYKHKDVFSKCISITEKLQWALEHKLINQKRCDSIREAILEIANAPVIEWPEDVSADSVTDIQDFILNNLSGMLLSDIAFLFKLDECGISKTKAAIETKFIKGSQALDSDHSEHQGFLGNSLMQSSYLQE